MSKNFFQFEIPKSSEKNSFRKHCGISFIDTFYDDNLQYDKIYVTICLC